MTVELFVAPAAAGKTTYALTLVRTAARNLLSTPRVVVPTYLQARAWRRRLAAAGGAIGVRVLTFDRLYAEILNTAGEVYTELSEPVRYRLIRAVVDQLPLRHYAPLKASPGFIQILEQLIAELKAARVWPEDLARAVTAMGDAPRLQELAQVYAAYQSRLQARGWADRAGLGWLAVEALEQRAPGVGRDWPLLVADGFDDLTQVQLEVLQALASRVGRLVVTLTGTPDDHGGRRPLIHQRFDRTRARLEQALGVEAAPLPQAAQHQAPALAHLEAHVFNPQTPQTPPVPAEGTLKLLAVPDRAAEVRAALRWLKRRLVHDKMRPGQVALLARSIPAYRPFITQIAAEFGLPIRLVDGLPLRANPAVVALLDLLRLMLPRDQGDAQPALPRRPLVEAWRSPYFDWSALPHAGAAAPIGIAPGDADALDAAARWGLVIDGLEQWAEVLQHLTRRSPENRDDEERDISAAVPTGDRARDLWDKLSRFVRRLTPPEGEHPYHDFCRWLEDLIGPDPTLASPRYPLPPEPTALQVVAAARDAPAPIAERDVAALQALKDVLRGLVWAEEALETEEQVDFVRFLEELVGAVEATSYRLPVRPERQEILVADVVQARGLPLRAVAVLGLAEGEFPAVLGEDPFLRDADRQQLREQFDVPLEPSIASAEAEFFYETLTRPSEKLLLTRPRLADNGAPWQASPYWEEVCRLVQVEPQTLTSEHRPAPDQVASWPELLESLSAHPPQPRVEAWLAEAAPERQAALDAAVALLQARTRAPDDERRPGAHDGDVTALGGTFARRFGPQHTWSASRLEAYRTCPFFFFVGSVLKLEPRAEPAAGLDARQLGNIYHHILEDVYQHPTVSDPADLSQLLEALPVVAKQVLDAAPAREGFRETAWWDHTREEIEDDVERSLQALAELPGAFVPHRFEAAFGLLGQPALVVSDGEDQFRLRGFIDRVDRAPDGCLRVIDYKTAGPYVYNNSAVRQGKKLQLPLYALGARDALGLGEPAEGFYWHVRHAEASPFKLAKFGPQEAMEQTVEYAWEAVRAARQGHFVPQTPDGGCPSYCPAAQMCWHYQPGYGG